MVEDNKLLANEEENEIINCVDKKGNVVGTIKREEGIQKGLLLEAIQLWVINPKTQEVLMQKRSMTKGHDAGMIDVSVSGHVRENEIPIQATLREAFEETGIVPIELYEKLQKLMEIQIDFTKYGRSGKYITHEYLAYLEHPLEYYKNRDGEAEKLFFMPYEEVKTKIKNCDKDMRIPYNEDAEKLFSILDEKIYNKENNTIEEQER